MKRPRILLLLIALLLLPVPVMAQVAQPSTSTQTATSRRTNNGRTTITNRQNTSRSNNNSHRQTTANTMTAKQMYKLAEDYYYGYNGKRKNYSEAFKWCKRSAEKGNIMAQCLLGEMYECGYGVAKSISEAIKWFKKVGVRDRGNGDDFDLCHVTEQAQKSLGDIYLEKHNYKEALRWYDKAASDLYTTAAFIALYNRGYLEYFGYFSRMGTGDVDKFKQLAGQGDTNAQEIMGLMYKYGNVYAVNDAPNTFRMNLQAAERGDVKAQNNLAWIYQYGYGVKPDAKEAVKWAKKAAEQSNPNAQTMLGNFYSHNRTDDNVYSDYYYMEFAVEEDKESAKFWYKQAALQGNIYAMCRLGDLSYYYDDKLDAFNWYSKAAELSCVPAQYKLGKIYERGEEGVPKNINEAIKWYKKAVEHGDAQAAECLGSIYECGEGVPKDIAEAIKWYKKAVALGADEDYIRDKLETLGQ